MKEENKHSRNETGNKSSLDEAIGEIKKQHGGAGHHEYKTEHEDRHEPLAGMKPCQGKK